MDFIKNINPFCEDCSSSREEEEGEESRTCSCETCMCDLQLAVCLHAAHDCPTALFGVLDRDGAQYNGRLIRRILESVMNY